MPGSRERTTCREFFRYRNLPNETYGIVKVAMGDGRFRVELKDPSFEIVTARIRGNMRDRVFVRVDDMVLVEFGDTIIKKYSTEEVRILYDAGELKEKTSEEEEEEQHLGFEFI